MKAFNTIDKIQFLDENAYSLDKQTYYPSVTTVISGALPKSAGFYQWLKQMGQEADQVGREAMDRGSRIHNAIEVLLKGEVVEWDDLVYDLQEWQQINRFVEFYERFTPEIKYPELPLVSNELRVGGTIDMPCILNGELWIIDHKTGKDLYDDYNLQLAAYASMYHENFPDEPFPKVGILWLNARTRTEGKGDAIQGIGWQLKEITTYERDIRIFKNVRENFDWLYPNWKPRNLEYPNKLKLKSEGFEP